MGGFPPKPPQTRTSAINAYGSSGDGFAIPVLLSAAVSCTRFRIPSHPSCFPTTVPSPGTTLSSFGSPRVGFAALFGTMMVLRRPAPFPSRFVSFTVRYRQTPHCFVFPSAILGVKLADGRDVTGSPLRSSMHRFSLTEAIGPPRFLGKPRAPMLCSSIPVVPCSYAVTAAWCCPP